MEEERERKSWEFFVAGVQHHRLDECIDILEEGDFLGLTREADNKYDPNAVRIEYKPKLTMIGYVPKKISAEVSALLDYGIDVSCEITFLDPRRKPWERIKVKLEERE